MWSKLWGGWIWDEGRNSFLALVVFLWGFALPTLEHVLWKKHRSNVNGFKLNTRYPSPQKVFFQTILYLKVTLQFPMLHRVSVQGAVILMENDKFFL